MSETAFNERQVNALKEKQQECGKKGFYFEVCGHTFPKRHVPRACVLIIIYLFIYLFISNNLIFGDRMPTKEE